MLEECPILRKIIQLGNLGIITFHGSIANETIVFITKCLGLLISTSQCYSAVLRSNHQLSTAPILKLLKAGQIDQAGLTEAHRFEATTITAEDEVARLTTLNRDPTLSPRTSTPASVLKVFLIMSGVGHLHRQWGIGVHLRRGRNPLGGVPRPRPRPMDMAARHTDLPRRPRAGITDDLHHRNRWQIIITTVITAGTETSEINILVINATMRHLLMGGIEGRPIETLNNMPSRGCQIYFCYFTAKNYIMYSFVLASIFFL